MAARKQLSDLITAGIDTHVHVGDGFHKDGGLHRMWTVQEAGNLGLSVVGKAHFLPFVPESTHIYGSVTLNGGLHPKLIERASKEMSRPWIVWFPSINAKAHYNAVAHDDAWQKLFTGITLGKPIEVTDKFGKLTSQSIETIDAICQTGAILATGHLSSDEVGVLVPRAIQMGVRSVVLTHVSSRHNRVSVDEQNKLIALGEQAGVPVYAEHCAITWIDGKEGAYDVVRDFIKPIQAVGAQHCILSSDSGRVVPSGSQKPATPMECLTAFSKLLIDNDLSLSDIQQMIVTNPRRLLQSNDA